MPLKIKFTKPMFFSALDKTSGVFAIPKYTRELARL